MKLILVHASFPVNFRGSWIYLGKNYLTMRRWEQRLSGKRISLGQLISEESEIQRPHILKWVGRQREANNDSLYWWMTHLAGRNNMATQFFDYLIQISALKSWVGSVRDLQNDVLVVCEDVFLLEAVKDNLHDINLETPIIGLWFGKIYDRLYYLLRAIYNLFFQIWWFWSHSRMARKTRPESLILNSGEIYLVHQCLDSKSFLAGDTIACRYFTLLPSWLEAQGKNVIRLPWLFNVDLPLDQVYRKLRASNCLIPEDWLTTSDYVNVLLDGYRSIFAILRNIEYEKLDISQIINRERYQQMGDGFKFAQFWRYGPALERWGCKLKSLTVYDTFEAIASEHIQVFTGRKKMGSKTKFVGYYHTIVSSDFLPYHIPAGEFKSIVYPDVIVTNGNLAKQTLIAQGLDENIIKVGPALRQSFVLPAPRPPRLDGTCLLLALSIIPEVTIELLDKISRLAPWINDHLGISVLVKPHPMMSKPPILKKLNWIELPNGWRWYDGEMHEALESAWCTMTLNTGAIIDVVAAGCIPFALSQSLSTPWNYLDSLSDEFPILRAVSDDQIKIRLEEIFILRREFFKSQTYLAQDRLLKGLSIISDQTMSAFI